MDELTYVVSELIEGAAIAAKLFIIVTGFVLALILTGWIATLVFA